MRRPWCSPAPASRPIGSQRSAPTPLLAFAVRELGCAAGVMITASHNPPQDNGYKVYLGDGAQIAPPVDERISAHIDRVGSPAELPLGGGGRATGDEIAEAYLDAILAALPDSSPRELRFTYTPLHGVGAHLCLEALERAGFPAAHVVAAQAEPDPDFPTVERPNPEEPGTLDLGLAEAAEHGADILLVNDPDADRLAVALPDPEEGWRRLHGDEIGSTARRLPARAPPGSGARPAGDDGGLLDAAGAHGRRRRGARYEETLTGFKWIMNALAKAPDHRLLLGYEEALGYAVSRRGA